MEGRFPISSRSREHLRKRIIDRYKRAEAKADYEKALADADAMIDRVKSFLEQHTPEDWRFTESPSSRFFIVDEKTQAKFMGLSYRDSQKGREILDFIQKNIRNAQHITSSLPDRVEEYKADVTDPSLPIIHDLRTVYKKGEKATIGEELKLFKKARGNLSHTIPLQSKRIASRPNAVLGTDGELWVRQYLNWVSMDPNDKEYYLFFTLRKEGLDRCRFTVFSHTSNGDLKRVGEPRELRCTGYHDSLGEIRKQFEPESEQEGKTDPTRVRSESYWKVPTCVDRRYIDLDFKERYTRKGLNPGEIPESESFLTADEALELSFLREIIERAQAKLHK